MAIETIQATERARTGSGALNAMRREGLVPSVIYGATENKNIKVHAKTFRDMLNASPSSQILINVQVEGSAPQRVFIQDLQFDAIIRQEPIDDSRLDPEDNLEEFGPVTDHALSTFSIAARFSTNASLYVD